MPIFLSHALVMALAAPPAKFKTNGAVLSLIDPKTRSKVVLVGAMHYNPRSVRLAREVVEQEAAGGRLRAVAVESCETRWNEILEVQPAGSLMRALCDNEMQSATEVGEDAGARVELVDQTIEVTSKRIAQLFALTLVDALTPWNGGWSRIIDDCSCAWEQVGGDGLKADAYLDPRLLLGAPLSIVRYPLALGLKSPVLAVLVGVTYLVFTREPADDETIVGLAGALGFALAETIVLTRVLLVGLLEERNYVIARNIRKACLAKPGGSVVAILGMAHCTGVGKLLRESRIV